jgi:transposase
MIEQHSESSCLKVVTVGKDGKRRFDRRMKQWLVEACLTPGASVAGLALKHGVNANLLRAISPASDSQPVPPQT